MPLDFTWPEFDGHPLQFRAQINLAEVNSVLSDPTLPGAGWLGFFGRDHSHDDTLPYELPADRNAWRVFYLNAEEPVALVPGPPQPVAWPVHLSRLHFRESFTLYSDMQREELDSEVDVATQHMTYDDWDAIAAGLGLDGDVQDRMLGYPNPGKRDPFDEAAQRARNTPLARSPDTDEWTLLLQTSNDDEENGYLLRTCFVIERSALAARRFDECWGVTDWL